MRNKKPVSPDRIMDIVWGYARSRALATGIELDIFTHIANNKNTVEQIAQATKSSRRGIEMLLNALVGLKLLSKDKASAYSLLPDSQEFLVRAKPGYLGYLSMHTAHLNEIWSHLTGAVKSGKPYMPVDEQKNAEDFFPDLIKALFNSNYPAARYAALYLKRKHKNISHVLDVACGSGVWSIANAEVFKSAKINALDFPGVLNITRQYVSNFKMNARYAFIEGDLRKIDFGKDYYDLIILGHICHSEGRVNTEKLLKKSFAALKMQGNLLIAEFLPNKAKTAPVIPLLFALNMLLNTNEGDVFTIREFQRWLATFGFKKIEILRQAPTMSPLILATK